MENVKLGLLLRIFGCSLLVAAALVGEPRRTIGADFLIQTQNRCGWFYNPTPGNAWLFDRDGEWTIGVQGGPQADGDWPNFREQWVETNGGYGYGCGCFSVN